MSDDLVDETDCRRAGAMFDETGMYRYRLWRYWEIREVSDPLVFLMLNPSTATAEKLDPTVRRCVEIARRMGHCGVEVLNIFAFKATDPKELEEASIEAGIDIIGPLNNDAIREVSKGRRMVMACGANRLAPRRLAWLMEPGKLEAREILCLRRTKDGWPAHPLYLPYALVPQPWSMP
jgi:hypothetical protein